MAGNGRPATDVPADAMPSNQRPRPRRRVGVLLTVAVTVLLLDIVSTVIVLATLPHRPPVRLLSGVLILRLVRNGGAAFGIGPSMTIVYTIVAVGVIVYILRIAGRLRSAPWAVALGLLLGGAAGNLTDRIFFPPAPFEGQVVDWIKIPLLPAVFNLADAAITFAVVLLVLLAVFGARLDGAKAADEHPAGADVG